jgi:hypothetical protein
MDMVSARLIDKQGAAFFYGKNAIVIFKQYHSGCGGPVGRFGIFYLSRAHWIIFSQVNPS